MTEIDANASKKVKLWTIFSVYLDINTNSSLAGIYGFLGVLFCMFPWEIFNPDRIVDSAAGSPWQVLTGVLLLWLWNEQQVKQPASLGPQVNI